jgi:hypothetical protein
MPEYKFPVGTFLLWLIGGMIALFIILALIAREASAHSFYSYECCSDRDCGPVDDAAVEERPDGYHVRGFVEVVKLGDPRLKWSPDDQDHVCARTGVAERIYCIYRRSKGQ